MHKVVREGSKVLIFGEKRSSVSERRIKPSLILVVLINPTDGTEITRTLTDLSGNFSIILSYLTPGNYQLRFYGSGMIEKMEPEGDWEVLNFQLGQSEVIQNLIDYERRNKGLNPEPDGVTSIFTISDDEYYAPGSTQLYLNTTRLVMGADYDEIGEGKVHLNFIPSAGDTLRIDYIKL